VPLAEDRVGEVPAWDELLCGDELTGPAGAFVVLGGAAYVPTDAEPWYAAICAAIAPAPGDQADDQVEQAQLLAPLDADDQADLDTPAGQADAGAQAESAQPASMPLTETKKNRTAPKWVRELHAYMQRLDHMSASELAGELQKWHNTEKKHGKARWSTDRIKAVEREIEQRDLLGSSTSDQADTPDSRPDADDQADLPPAALSDERAQPPEATSTGEDLPPPACSEGFGAGSGLRVESRRCVWRSPVVRVDWEPEPLPLREMPRRTHPIAELGINPESMQAAHEYCAAVLARSGESAK
jgi:hypothetical protein